VRLSRSLDWSWAGGCSLRSWIGLLFVLGP
jgi:hypothetical protein